MAEVVNYKDAWKRIRENGAGMNARIGAGAGAVGGAALMYLKHLLSDDWDDEEDRKRLLVQRLIKGAVGGAALGAAGGVGMSSYDAYRQMVLDSASRDRGQIRQFQRVVLKGQMDRKAEDARLKEAERRRQEQEQAKQRERQSKIVNSGR